MVVTKAQVMVYLNTPLAIQLTHCGPISRIVVVVVPVEPLIDQVQILGILIRMATVVLMVVMVLHRLSGSAME